VREVENFNQFGYQSAVEKDTHDKAEALFPNEEEEGDDEQKGKPDKQEMLCPKQGIVVAKNRMHKIPLLCVFIRCENIIAQRMGKSNSDRENKKVKKRKKM
jgi:hypothetical protein